MNQLELSIIQWGGGPLPPITETLAEILEPLGMPCQLNTMAGNSAWEELAKIALYRFGPDVSQIGTTWLDDLAMMGALRPFTDQEIDTMGGPSAFIPSLWKTACLPSAGQARTWAVPWLADVRVIFYWRDMLEQAGIDEETAFETPERIAETMARLQASQVSSPWGVWSSDRFTTLQNAASWIWEAGGNFASSDGKQILFNQPEARKGLLAYLDLVRHYTSPDVTQLSLNTISLFTKRQAAVAMGPCRWLLAIQSQNPAEDIEARLGIAAPPGPAFVGGSHLVVWRHSQRAQDAVALVRTLISKQLQVDLSKRAWYLPARQDALTEPLYMSAGHHQTVVETLQTGRSFPVFSKWGAIEHTLSETMEWFWNNILTNREQDIESLVTPYLDSLARRLSITLKSRT